MFDYFRERRFAPIFVITIIVLSVTLLLLKDLPLRLQMECLLPGVGLLMMVVVLREIRRIRTERRNRYQSSPLSRDERRKARSKLCNNMNQVRPTAPRAPDIDLKY